ncbi:MAG TPA: hypothetical protein VFV98_00325 [Vicinamibacterales bacterium]|nr:hypothetical protein [Vicinamibacterales bacterium]
MRTVPLRSLRLLAVAITVFAASQPIAVIAQARTPQRPPQVAPGLIVMPDVRTKLEFALTTPNALIVADFHQIDFRFGPSVRIDAVLVRVGPSQQLVRGLRLQVQDTQRAGNPERSSYIDAEEIEGFAHALGSMVDLVKTWSAGSEQKMTALSFQSIDGLRIEIRESLRFQRGFIFTGLIDPVVTPFELADLTALKQAIDQAAAFLRGK